MLKKGFYCALGTPLDDEGRLVEHSLCAHIEDQIAAGASGLLLMGTMGMMGCVRQDEYERVVSAAVRAVRGRVPLMVGGQDNSIARLRERLDVLNKYDVAVVVTAPYYFAQSRETANNCLRSAAGLTHHDVYLYDHPYTAKYKLDYEDVSKLAQIPNVKGVKTGDPILIKALHDDKNLKADFTPIFSNSDLFVMGWAYGIEHILDGIFACFPRTISHAQKAFETGDFEGGKAGINRLMAGRDLMGSFGMWSAFRYAMNLLGFEGDFAPDYEPALSEEGKEAVYKLLVDIGELEEKDA